MSSAGLGFPDDFWGWPIERREAWREAHPEAFNGAEAPPKKSTRKMKTANGADDSPCTCTKVRTAARSDDEVGPVMKLLDDALTNVAAAEPPMRDVECWPVEIQCRETGGLHELAPEGRNDEDDEKSRLPSPRNFLLTKHDKESLEILIGDHVTFIRKSKAEERAVAPPTKFVAHYSKYRRSKLPRVHALLTMPLVLPDGTLLARNGLDRRRRAVFRIDPALLPFIPKAEDCTASAVDEAFKFLTDEWLCDVATDLEGKCVLIALALTIVERILLPARPLFFVTAALRGGGKTTVLMMIALAATGIKAAAAAWSPDPNEWKKALFSYLLPLHDLARQPPAQTEMPPAGRNAVQRMVTPYRERGRVRSRPRG